jgi:Flp pilus assembly protein TadG
MLLPVLVTVVLGCVDFGRFACNYIALANAARAGASYGSMNNYTASTLASWKTGVGQAAKDEMTQQVGAANIGNMVVTVPDPTQDANGLRRVRVTVSYPFTTVVNWSWSGLGLPHTMTLQQQAEMRLIR